MVLNQTLSTEIFGLKRCNYCVIHTLYCTWSSFFFYFFPTSCCQLERKPGIFRGGSIKSAFRPTREGGETIKGRTFIFKQNHNIPLKNWQIFLECCFGTDIPQCLCAAGVRVRVRAAGGQRGDSLEGLIVSPAEATLALMSLIASHHSDGESRWSGRSSHRGVIQPRPSGHRVEDNEALSDILLGGWWRGLCWDP